MNALSPVDNDALKDAASTLQSQAREAIALIERRDRTSPLTFSAELQDLGGEADEISSDILHEAVQPDVEAQRDRLADAAAAVADAADEASLAVDDPARLDKARGELQKLVDELDRIGGGS